jgi:hypothetical protein
MLSFSVTGHPLKIVLEKFLIGVTCYKILPLCNRPLLEGSEEERALFKIVPSPGTQ